MTHMESCWQEYVLSPHASNFCVLPLLHYIYFDPGVRVKMGKGENGLYFVMFLKIDLPSKENKRKFIKNN
jgi:hypothetical protein